MTNRARQPPIDPVESRQLPSGTVTMLFTDIEGSTRLLKRLGDRYGDALRTHRRLLREALGRHGGVEVDTQGDAFFYAFPTAQAAVAAAQEGQAALTGSEVRVRMGLHSGEPTVMDAGYVGIDVHRAGRICAAANGGQVLISDSAAHLVDADLKDLGEHRLKDFEGRQRLFQLGQVQFPSLRVSTFTSVAFLAASTGDHESAGGFLGAAQREGTFGHVLEYQDRVDYERTIQEIRRTLGKAGLERAMAVGRTLSLDSVLLYLTAAS